MYLTGTSPTAAALQSAAAICCASLTFRVILLVLADTHVARCITRLTAAQLQIRGAHDVGIHSTAVAGLQLHSTISYCNRMSVWYSRINNVTVLLLLLFSE